MRRGGTWWWGVWVLGGALLSFYIAFDVLDLDGSEFPPRVGVTLTAASSAAEVDRPLRLVPPFFPVEGHPGQLAPRVLESSTIPSPLARRGGCVLPRRHCPDRAPTPAPSPDPL